MNGMDERSVRCKNDIMKQGKSLLHDRVEWGAVVKQP